MKKFPEWIEVNTSDVEGQLDEDQIQVLVELTLHACSEFKFWEMQIPTTIYLELGGWPQAILQAGAIASIKNRNYRGHFILYSVNLENLKKVSSEDLRVIADTVGWQEAIGILNDF